MNLPDFQMPVPANPPDAGTLIAVQFGQDWIPALLTVLDVLREPEFWLSPPSDIQEQIDELNDRLQNLLIIQPQVFQNEVIHFHRLSKVIFGQPLTTVIDTATMFNFRSTQSPASINDHFRFDAILSARTYNVIVIARTQSAAGIITMTTGEGEVSTFDLYSAVTTSNVEKTSSLVVHNDGILTFDCVMGTKNISSTGYACPITAIMFF